MLAILNWITISFVRKAIGDCVASALTIQDGRITLYLAANRGQPEDEDVRNGTEFISALHRAFLQDPETAQEELFKSLISITYQRLSRKFKMITDIHFPSRIDDPIEIFKILITKWAEAGGVEQDQNLIRFAQLNCLLDSGGDGIDALKVLFKNFIQMTRRWRDYIDRGEEHGKLWVTGTWGLCQTAIHLVYTDFFRDVVPNDVQGIQPFDAEEYNWLRKLRRRLWRIARYWLDAGAVASTGIKWIKKILGDNEFTFTEGDRFKVVWVGGLDADTLPEGHGVPYAFPERPFQDLVAEI
jgi:hypothetical protein